MLMHKAAVAEAVAAVAKDRMAVAVSLLRMVSLPAEVTRHKAKEVNTVAEVASHRTRVVSLVAEVASSKRVRMVGTGKDSRGAGAKEVREVVARVAEAKDEEEEPLFEAHAEILA